MDETSASFLDKTDWRITIHRKLERCVNAEGTPFYPNAVKSLISAVSADYPNWNAKKEIEEEIIVIEQKYTELYNRWLGENSTTSRWKKYNQERMYYMMAHKEIFEFIKNMLARKRMLLWGTKRIGGGTQIQFID